MRQFSILSIAFSLGVLQAASANAQTQITNNNNTVSTNSTGTVGITATATAANPDVKVITGDTSSTSGFKVFNSTNAELFRVESDGKVFVNSTAAVAFNVNNTNNPGLAISNGGAWKFTMGIPTTANNWVVNSVANDVGFRADGGGKMLFSTSSTGSTNDLTISAGRVGIGTASPAMTLDVVGSARFGTDFTSMLNPLNGGILVGQWGVGGPGELQFLSCGGTGCGAYGYGFRMRGDSSNGTFTLDRRWNSAAWTNNVLTVNDKGVGIGTATQTGIFEVNTSATGSPIRFEDGGTYSASGSASGSVVMNVTGSGQIRVANLLLGYATAPVIQTTGPAGSSSLNLNQFSDNDVVIGSSSYTARGLKVLSSGTSTFAGAVSMSSNLTVTGTINGGVINAKFQDVAEWVPASAKLEPGTVVVLDRQHENQVTASTRAYDTAVAGVVSRAPGIVLGEASDEKAKVATTGRVMVRVDATKHPISIGDLLVSGEKPGTAMWSEPIEINGRKFHQPGTVIGKALQPLANGEGEILVLLSLQ